jgi:hypothetical protein
MIMNFSLEFSNLTSKQLKLLGQFIKVMRCQNYKVLPKPGPIAIQG